MDFGLWSYSMIGICTPMFNPFIEFGRSGSGRIRFRMHRLFSEEMRTIAYRTAVFYDIPSP